MVGCGCLSSNPVSLTRRGTIGDGFCAHNHHTHTLGTLTCFIPLSVLVHSPPASSRFIFLFVRCCFFSSFFSPRQIHRDFIYLPSISPPSSISMMLCHVGFLDCFSSSFAYRVRFCRTRSHLCTTSLFLYMEHVSLSLSLSPIFVFVFVSSSLTYPPPPSLTSSRLRKACVCVCVCVRVCV